VSSNLTRSTKLFSGSTGSTGATGIPVTHFKNLDAARAPGLLDDALGEVQMRSTQGPGSELPLVSMDRR
jgi:hypothetical protein